MKIWIYDIECYPNFWSIVFYDTKNDWFTIYSHENKIVGDFKKLKTIYQKDLMVGWNSKSYDIHILEGIVKNPSNESVYQRNLEVFGNDLRCKNNRSIDLARLIFNKQIDSLKMMGVKLRHNRLEELPIAAGTPIESHQIEELLSYNRNDVEITYKLYLELKPILSQRVKMAKLDKVNSLSYLSLNDSWYADNWIKTTLAEILNVSKWDLRHMELEANTKERLIFPLKNVTLPHIEEHIASITEISDWYNEYRKIEYPTIPTKKIPKLNLNGLNLSLGYGGIHSEDKPRYLVEKEGFLMIDADVSSQYPNKIIGRSIINPKLPIELLRNFEKKVAYRLEMKALASNFKKTDAAMYDHYNTIATKDKIVVNTFYGKYGQPNHPLYDPFSMLQVTVNNQMEIVWLIYQLQSAGIEVFSANTDGFTSYVPIDLKDTYYKICSEWEIEMKMTLEYATYVKFIQSNVNNYIAIPDYAVKDGVINRKSIKFKGWFNSKQELNKGVLTSIVSKSLCDYFIDEIDPYDSITNEDKTIYDFVYCKRADRKFEVYYGENEKIKSINRFYIANNGKTITKRDGERSLSMMIQPVQLINDIKVIETNHYDIDYDFYLSKIYDIIKEIMPKYTIAIRKNNGEIRIFERVTKLSEERVKLELDRVCKNNAKYVLGISEKYKLKTIKDWLNDNQNFIE